MYRTQKLQAAVFTVFLAFSTFAFAQDNDDFYIAPFGSYLKTDDTTNGFDGFGAGLAIGKEFNEYFNVEIRGFWQKYDNDYSCCQKVPNLSLDGDSQLTGGTVDVQLYLQRDTFSPYVVAAVGGMNTDYRMDSVMLNKKTAYRAQTTSFIFESGVGVSYQITDSIAFRSDVRYRLNSFLNDKSDGEVFHDVTINFGFVTNV